MRSQLRLHSKWKKTALIIPLLASEYTDPANLPVLKNILKQLKNVSYLSNIIFGLDRASKKEAKLLKELIVSSGIKNDLIQWNDGPGFSSIYKKLNKAGFNIRNFTTKNMKNTAPLHNNHVLVSLLISFLFLIIENKSMKMNIITAIKGVLL